MSLVAILRLGMLFSRNSLISSACRFSSRLLCAMRQTPQQSRPFPACAVSLALAVALSATLVWYKCTDPVGA